MTSVQPAAEQRLDLRPFERRVPLTEAQEGLWYAQRLDPANPIYNTGQYVELRGRLDVAAFQDAVNTALAEADALSVRIADDENGPVQYIDAAARAELRIVDMRHAALSFDAALAWIERDMATPLDMSRDTLVAQVLFVLGDEHHVWYQRAHHIVIDGYGTALLTTRVCDLYTARVLGTAPASKPFGDADAWFRQAESYKTSESRAADREFWLAELEGMPEVAGLAHGRALTAHTYHRHVATMPAELDALVAQCAAASEVAWPDVLVSLSAAYIGRHTGEQEIVVGVPTMNRMGSAAARVPAMVMNVLPVRLVADEDSPLSAHLVANARRLRRARRHGTYRSEQMRRDLGLLGGERRLYGAMVNVLPFDEVPTLPYLEAKLCVLGTGPVDDLTITWRADTAGRGIRLELDANPQLYSPSQVEAHAKRLTAFVSRALQAETLAHVPTLTPEEHEQWVYRVNDTAHDVEPVTLAELLERAMRDMPGKEAVVFEGGSLSYAELDARTRALAGVLQAHGVQRGNLVAVSLPRSMELVVALVAILRAGAAYLPIDAAHPDERIAQVLQSAHPRLVLVNDETEHRFNGLAERTYNVLAATTASASFTPVDIGERDAAYVIYTSGSTGIPKGVVIEHRAIVNRLLWMREQYGVDANDRILQKTPVTFDVSVWEFFLPLITGATLVVAPPESHKDPAWLAKIIREHGITTAHFVPSMLSVFLTEPAAAGLRMRRVFCSGEALSSALRDQFHRTVRAELHNLYGPTEAAVDVTYWDASAGDTSEPVPIGRPVWNTSVYVLDARGRAVPPGVQGELYIGGRQVARGYLGDSELTDSRFLSWDMVRSGPGWGALPNNVVSSAEPPSRGLTSVGSVENEKVYKTGDLVRWREDGAIVYHGRLDFQVKVRGLRVELGDIESAILQSGLVNTTVVTATARQQIVAYVTALPGGVLDLDAIRAFVQGKVPEYMVPNVFVPLESLPITSSGKVDRKSLPTVSEDINSTEKRLNSDTEEKIAGIFADVLGITTPLGAEDDFFRLGGHSLLAAKMTVQLRQLFGEDISLGVIFAYPTIGKLAAHLDAVASTSSDTDDGLGVFLHLSGDNAELPPLFAIHPAGGISWCYGTLGRALRHGRKVFALQARTLDPRALCPDSLDDMAADYIREIFKNRKKFPIHLVGWSVGGILAHAMAVQLRAAGHEVGVVAMLDAYPCDRWRNEPDPDESMALRALLLIAGHDPDQIATLPLKRADVVRFLKQGGHPLGELSDDALSGVVRTVDNNARLVRRHQHGYYDGAILHFRAALDHVGENISPNEWRPYVRDIEVHDIPSLHAHMTGPDAAERIAVTLEAHLGDWDARTRTSSFIPNSRSHT